MRWQCDGIVYYAIDSYLSEIKARLPLFDLVIIQWIPENQNKGADNLARQGLQKRLASKNRR